MKFSNLRKHPQIVKFKDELQEGDQGIQVGSMSPVNTNYGKFINICCK